MNIWTCFYTQTTPLMENGEKSLIYLATDSKRPTYRDLELPSRQPPGYGEQGFRCSGLRCLLIISCSWGLFHWKLILLFPVIGVNHCTQPCFPCTPLQKCNILRQTSYSVVIAAVDWLVLQLILRSDPLFLNPWIAWMPPLTAAAP